jgi:hypothetical protein
MKSWLPSRKARARKPAVRLSVEALEDRLVPAPVAATHVVTNLSQIAKASALTPLVTAAATAPLSPVKVTGMGMPMPAGLLRAGGAQLGTPDWAAAWAATLARLAQPQGANAATTAGKAVGPGVGVDDTAGSDAAWIANLQQQLNQAQGSGGQDLVGTLIQVDSQAASTLADRILGEAGQAMTALRDALQTAGVSQHDLDRLFGGGGVGAPASGGANSSVPFGHSGGGGVSSSQGGGGRMPDSTAIGASPLLQFLFGSRDQADGWSSQLPFLSVTQGQDPIQVGAAHQGVDWRAADEPGPDCTGTKKLRGIDDQGGGSASTSTDGSNTGVTVTGSTTDAGGNVTTTYSNGCNSTVFPNGSWSKTCPVNGDGSTTVSVFSDGRIMIEEREDTFWGFGPSTDKITFLDEHGKVDAMIFSDSGWFGRGGSADLFYLDGSGNISGHTHLDFNKMPNPDGEDPRVAPAIAGVSDLRGPRSVGASGAADDMGFVPGAGRGGWMSDRLAQSMVAWLGSTVNPNPGGAGGNSGEGSGQLPVTGLGPHGGDDPIGAAAGGHGNVHPGGNPVIVFGIGGPGPGVGPGPKVN